MRPVNNGRAVVTIAAAGGVFLIVAVATLLRSLHAETTEELKANLDLPYDAGSGTDGDDEAPEVMVFYGESFEGEGFFYCIDGSMSMGDGAWQTLQRELGRSILGLKEDMQFGFVIFNKAVLAFPNSGKPTVATTEAKKAALTAVAAATPDSWTCLKEGLTRALEMANASEGKRRSVVLLSDGKPTCPGTDFVTYREEIFAEVRSKNTKGVEIHTLGIGSDVDESFLRRLSRDNQGNYRRVSR